MAGERFTPGPWYIASRRELCDSPRYIVLGGGNTGVCIIGEYETMEVDTRWANAALIAAAPELYEALHSLLDASERHIFSTECLSQREAARAALAKATPAEQSDAGERK